MYDVIIIGAGAAGMTAAIYTCRKKLKTAIISIDVGGQTNLTSHIENYPGTGPMHGIELMKRFQDEAVGFGAELIMGKVNKVDKIENSFRIGLANGETYDCRALILAYGKVPKSLGIEGEDKFMGRGVSTCVTCFPPEADVIVNYDIKKISDLKEGEKVLTHDGTFRTITKTMKRHYNGDLIKIKPMYFREGFSLTPEHPVLVWNKEKLGSKWLSAKDIRKDSILLYPIVKKIQDTKKLRITDYLDVDLDSKNYVHNKRETHTSVVVPNNISVNEEFLRLVGYYLSEGCITHIGLKFSFSENQKGYVDDVKNIVKNVFKLNPKIEKEDNVLNVYVFSSLIRDLFREMFGKYAHNKHMPNWILYLPHNKQAEVVKAMWRGDGCKRLKDFTYVTNSKKLAYQLRILLLRFGIVPSTEIRKKENLKPGKIDGREIIFRHDKYHIIIKGAFLEKGSEILGMWHDYIKKRNRTCHYAKIDSNYVYMPIRKIEKISYNGPVYNIAVEDNNSYTVSAASVHNCDAPLFKNRDVVIIGGGNSAVEGALELATFSKKVYLVHRRDSFRADELTVQKLKDNPQIDLVLNSVPLKIIGEKNVEGIEVENIVTKEKREIKIDGVFIEIGYVVDTSFVQHLVKVNEKKEIIVDERSNTSHPGIFAAGDITPVPFKQTVIAAGEGSKAALECYRWLTGGKGAVLDWTH